MEIKDYYSTLSSHSAPTTSNSQPYFTSTPYPHPSPTILESALNPTHQNKTSSPL